MSRAEAFNLINDVFLKSQICANQCNSSEFKGLNQRQTNREVSHFIDYEGRLEIQPH